MGRHDNIIYVYDDETGEYIGKLPPSGCTIEDITKICTMFKQDTIKITEVRWPDYHTLQILVRGKSNDIA